MIGAIIGDIAGSRFEFGGIKIKDFELMSADLGCHVTDDSVMTLAVAKSLLSFGGSGLTLSELAVIHMQDMGCRYPNAGYGGMFRRWIKALEPQPYNSYGNGSAMRVSPCAYAASSLEEALFFRER